MVEKGSLIERFADMIFVGIRIIAIDVGYILWALFRMHQCNHIMLPSAGQHFIPYLHMPAFSDRESGIS